MEAERAGLGIVDQAGGIVGAHLKEDAHLKFAKRLAAQKAVHVIESVAGEDDVKSETGSFRQKGVEERGGIRHRIGVARGKAEVLLIPKSVVLLQAVNEEESGGSFSGLRVVGPFFHFL